MSDSKSFNTSLLNVIISSNNERVIILDFSNLALQIIFDACWASMKVDSKRPIARNHYRHAPSSRFYSHCGIDETGSPGIICMVRHQVLRDPSEHGTSSMGKHLLAKAHNAKLNELIECEVTELTSSMVDETALSILKRQGSRGITIVSSQWKIRFDIQVDTYWQKWQTKLFKLAANNFEASEFHQDPWNRNLMLVFVSTHSQWKAISNLELRRSYQALHDHLVLPSDSPLSNICRREYALKGDAIQNQLPSPNKVSSAVDEWTSTNKLASRSVIGCYMDRNWALSEIQLAFDEVDRLFFSLFES